MSSQISSNNQKTGLVPVRDNQIIELPKRSILRGLICSLIGHVRSRPFWWTTAPGAQTYSVVDQRCERCGAEIYDAIL